MVFLLVSNTPSFAQEKVCFDAETAKKLVVELEKCQILKEELVVYQEQEVELKKQTALLKDVIALQQQQTEAYKTALKNYQDLLKTQGDTYKEQIENSKPSFTETFLKSLGLIGIGLLIGLLL